MSGVFISYRRKDTRHIAGRLYSELTRRYGPDRVFRDTMSIAGGERWERRILDQVRQSDVLLVVIGPRWLDLGDFTDLADSTRDWVRAEIRTAIASDVTIIPVLVDGTAMPDIASLPDDIAELSERNARPLGDENFDDELRRILSDLPLSQVEPRSGLRGLYDRMSLPVRRTTSLAITAIGLISALLGIYQFLGPDAPIVPMSGGFNIAVARLDAVDGTEDDRSNALLVGAALERALADLDDGRYEIWGPERVGVVTESNVAERANELNAQLLVYGTIERDSYDDYRTVVRVHSTRQNDRAPWPLNLDEVATFEIPPRKVVDGSISENAKVETLALTLDGLAALIGDSLDIAWDRLSAAETRARTPLSSPEGPFLEDEKMRAIILVMQSYLLLVEATYDHESAGVADAKELALKAIELDPGLELAHVVSFSSDYLDIVPPGPAVLVDCDVPAEPVTLPSPSEVADLRGRIDEFSNGASAVGQIQLASLLARLSIADWLSDPSDQTSLDDANASFRSIVGDTASDPTLTFWTSDAHRGLALLEIVADDTDIETVVDHYLTAAQIDTPIWKARDLGMAGWAHRCLASGSDSDAICYFEDASIRALDDERVQFARAAREIEAETGSTCPENWTPPLPATG